MATRRLPHLLFLLSLVAATASARPCKTLFYFRTTATNKYYPYNSFLLNPNSANSQGPRYFTLIFTTATTRFPNRHASIDLNSSPSLNDESHSSLATTASDFLMKLYSSVYSSICDRTKDMMRIVCALVFGVTCGAITTATMYIVWALCSLWCFDTEDGDDDDVTAAKKKLGYVAIPAQPKFVDDDLKKPASEVV